jgi:hypothetical protein
VLRVNKAGVLVFRAMLREGAPHLIEARLLHFNRFALDLVFTGWRLARRGCGGCCARQVQWKRPRRAAGWPCCGGCRHERQQAITDAYVVKEPICEECEPIWTRIGAAWPHGHGVNRPVPVECTRRSGQGQAADLTICRACSCSNLTGLR